MATGGKRSFERNQRSLATYLGQEFETGGVAGLFTIDRDFAAHFKPWHAENRPREAEFDPNGVPADRRTFRMHWETTSRSVRRGPVE